MAVQRKSTVEFPVEELDRELIARGAQTIGDEQFKFKDKEGTPERHTMMAKVKELYDISLTPNQALSHISTWELVETLKLNIRKENIARGIWYEDDRRDFYKIEGEQIKKNADCVAAICLKDNLIDEKGGFSTLKHKNYGTVFNLCSDEPFRNQPIAVGRLCSGFLVKEDVIATAGHCTDERDITRLRFVFGFKMSKSSTTLKQLTQVPNENIYKGVEMFHRIYDPKGSGADWALIRLDRKVVGHPVVKLYEKSIYHNQPVYILGHPCGLPLKYASGAQVRDIDKSFFSADLNVYCGNSGSPVFEKDTHEVIGIVVRGDTQDFRWTGRGWLSIIYPNPDINSQEPQCTRVSEFIAYCR
jgi:V8-like Glu-specific endopeptidase